MRTALAKMVIKVNQGEENRDFQGLVKLFKFVRTREI